MLKLFCPNCGSSNEYISQKPKFCGQCQKSLDISTAHLSYKSNPIKQQEDTYVEDTNFDSTYGAESFKFEIEPIKDDMDIKKGISLGEIGKMKKTGFKRDINPNNLSKDEILNNFKNLAKPNKQSISAEESENVN